MTTSVQRCVATMRVTWLDGWTQRVALVAEPHGNKGPVIWAPLRTTQACTTVDTNFALNCKGIRRVYKEHRENLMVSNTVVVEIE